MRDLFAPDPAPMLPLEFPQIELEGRIRRLRSPRYVDYEAGNAILGRLAWLPNRGANCVNEGGLFSLILGSKKPEAREFMRRFWDEAIHRGFQTRGGASGANQRADHRAGGGRPWDRSFDVGQVACVELREDGIASPG